ncbi:hypothetical protein IPV69_25220 [Humisphaera borealis]|uniref:Uncharacterized protein n=1 Tax=Humisphaera borealis TaxID=2807512 RepID=A0A7M2X451_9BACT|nr:hypothetical protein IPV69_25220 [Humisphaera borealis]
MDGRAFHINGKPTYAGRTWEGKKIEGLLMNSRMVQATFDDENPETRKLWAYADGSFDADRNTNEFIAAMPEWRRHGLLGIGLNLQGGSPQGYSKDQPWVNSAFDFNTGALKPAYMARVGRILDKADELGMVPIVGLFYFGQSPRLKDEQTVIAATDAATDWLIDKGYTNVLVEIANECNVKHTHEIIRPARAHELIERVQQRSKGKLKTPAGRLLVSTSYGGGTLPGENVAKVADFLLLHGNGIKEPAKAADLVRRTRALKAYRDQPIFYNEDDHFDFDKPVNNFTAATGEYAGWGYFDYRLKGETAFEEGYQSVPVSWGITSERKEGFFGLLKRMTQGTP